MNSFQKIVIIIATVILIICLILIGISLHNKNGSAIFPPVVASCPDYWTVKGKKCSVGKFPISTNCHIKEIDVITADSTRREKCRAQRKIKNSNCDITWDGITNNHHLCGRHDHGN